MRKGRLGNYIVGYSKHKPSLGDSGKGSGSYFEKRNRLCESHETGYRPRTRGLCLIGASEHAHKIRQVCAGDQKASMCTCTPHVCPEGRLFVTRQDSKII